MKVIIADRWHSRASGECACCGKAVFSYHTERQARLITLDSTAVASDIQLCRACLTKAIENTKKAAK